MKRYIRSTSMYDSPKWRDDPIAAVNEARKYGNWSNIENSVLADHGLLFDNSIVLRGGRLITVYESDVITNWSYIGDLDNWEYCNGLVEEVLSYPEDEWRSRYEQYLTTLEDLIYNHQKGY